MRLLGAVVAIAGTVWMMAGCGSVVARVAGLGMTNGLVLSDSVTQMRYGLSVTNGAPVLTGMVGTGASTADPELVDGTTGTSYGLGVANGALTLAPMAGSSGVKQIGLADTATSDTYNLAVAGGALVLIPNEGAGQ